MTRRAAKTCLRTCIVDIGLYELIDEEEVHLSLATLLQFSHRPGSALETIAVDAMRSAEADIVASQDNSTSCVYPKSLNALGPLIRWSARDREPQPRVACQLLHAMSLALT